MKRSRIFLCVFVLCLCFVWNQVGQATPQLEVVDGTSFNFGDIQANTTLTHTFILKNVGDSLLKIEKVRAGWGCNASLPSGDEIPPGGEGKLNVKIRSGNRRQQIRQVVIVQTNDPQNKSLKFTVAARVKVELETIPNLLRFDKAQSDLASVKIKNYSHAPVELSDLHSSTKYVNLSVSSMTIPPEGEIIITGELSPKVPQGILSGWVKLRTNLKSVPIIQIRIWGQVPWFHKFEYRISRSETNAKKLVE